MKKFLQFMMLMAFGLVAFQSNAQMAAGCVAPNFTITDIEGNNHTLYDYLDDGYTVILDFSATWCVPCWNYHTSGALEEVWEFHGPAGMEGVSETTTDDVMIFFIEGDDDTTLDDLEGTGSNTTGDWTDGTYYPIADDLASLFYEYECTYFPTMYTVCPDRLITETGQLSADDHYDWAQNNCAPPTVGADGTLQYGCNTNDMISCGEVDLVVDLANVGDENLTMATITVTGCDNCPIEVDWTGDLGTYDIASVDLGTALTSGDVTLNVEITSTDSDDTNNSNSIGVTQVAIDATTQWFLTLSTDCWPGETSWEVKDGDGAVVANAPQGTYADGETTYNETFNVGAIGCYEFMINDSYGDGMFGSQWGTCDTDGSYSLTTAAGEISSYDGSYNFESISEGANASTVSVNELAGVNVVWNVYPNPTNAITNINYSIDSPSEVVIEVYNILGERVLSQDLGTLAAGQYLETLDLTSNEAGVYIINLNANGNVSTQRVTLN